MLRSGSRKWIPVVAAAAAVAMATLGIQVTLVADTVASAAPSGPTDETKVPHYFGPWPNWANSPLTLSTAEVQIDGAGSGAAAVAQVDPVTGGIKVVDVTAPGHDYAAGSTTVTVAGSTGTQATATATVSTSGVVVGFADVVAGSGYSSFEIGLSGGGGTGASAIGSGGIDAIAIDDGGIGYTMPTVDFDLPESPDGTVPRAHAEIDADGVVTAVVVDSPGSGYTSAPAVTIRNGTQFDPLNFPEGGGPATVTATLALSAVNVVDFGSGYAGAPDVTITDPSGTGTGADATALTDVGAITAITVDTPGDGYLDTGMRKFVDDLPGTCTPPSCPADPSAKFIPTAVPAETGLRRGQGGPVRHRPGAVPHEVLIGPPGRHARARLRAARDTGQYRSQPARSPRERTARRDEGSHPRSRREFVPGRDRAALPRTDHRRHEGPAGSDRLPQPAADRRRRRPVPADRLAR